ncbi:isocitrate/isopropylmalate dehydrogenase family protein [Acuticoccus sp. M5D2P5]|uniref:isocitrate/isopropylmalate dehydrogenase family protein n=1 Tax=Acuticoccus kalidii TaxID=2910977 RepID=UPI001F3F2BDA|nr:isocitrate/isopropylmalate dehydrogenase family protein [Acuticoccus kalidii]MCF3934566.1 isocitrate/isopropylmalate dehydrogenase family protein [Acuticoccus kalidii]
MNTTTPKTRYEIAVVEGDGIGPEVCQAGLKVIQTALGDSGKLNFKEYRAGAELWKETGVSFPDETFAACRDADAVFHGAAGLPTVTAADGTEPGLDFGLQLRFRLDLYANIRPIKLHPGVTSVLRDYEPGQIDYVILRENTEGFYAARGGGNIVRGKIASDTSIITREGTERIVRRAFELSRSRNGAPRDGKRRVTVCDKANVLRSYAFFRAVAKEVAADYPDIELDFALIDAMTVHLVKRPDFYDVIVTENMFGDIISDLGAATVGGMGMSPTAEVGDHNGFFQAAHGSAPDIAGQGIANPIGTILSGGLMLTWLGERHRDNALIDAGARIDRAVGKVIENPNLLPGDLGGTATSAKITDAVCEALAA